MSKQWFVIVLVGAAVAIMLSLPAAGAAPARSPQSVTLQVSRTFDKLLHFYRLRFATCSRR